MLLVVDHCRMGAVDRIAKKGDESHIRQHFGDPFRHSSGPVAPHHVPGGSFADDGFARPARKLCAVPLQAEGLEAGRGMEETGLARRRIDLGMTARVDS